METTLRPVAANPVTKERAIILTDPRTHPEGVLVAQLTVAPGGRVAAAHYHPRLRERFLIMRGRFGFLLGDRQTTLGPGEHADVAPGVVHDWWQVGDEDAQAIVEVSPGGRFLEIVGTMFGLARDGKVSAKGMPSPLQLAVMAHEYRDTVVFTSPPPAVQRVVMPPLAAIGRLLGRRPMIEAYIEASETEEPDPAVLAELTEDGRLRPFTD